MYVSLYRKWRPQKFEDVVGQDETIKVLMNSIKLNRVSHAYLFCGPRGTGKTSCARILAKALNCDIAATPTPCQTCKSCESITNGTSMDVIEIDAASNRGIDNIRELRERVKLSPVNSRYKIYIIDEVHMLTGEAFNALLKTIEEPPPNTVFVMATTEPHKMPQTIISRCQRFDYKRISPKIISSKLQKEADNLEIKISERALNRIAEISEGSLRDAESLLDQLLSYTDNEISEDDVISMLGRVNVKTFYNLFDTIYSKSYDELISLLAEINGSSADITQFTKDMISYSRDLFILKKIEKGSPNLKIIPFDEIELYLKQASELPEEFIIKIISEFQESLYKMRFILDPYLLFELNILKIKVELLQPVLPDISIKVAKNESSNLSADDPWNKFLSKIKDKDLPLYILLSKTTINSVDESSSEILFPENQRFHASNISKPDTLEKIRKEYVLFTNKNIKLNVRVIGDTEVKKKDDIKQQILEDKSIINILDLFDATVQEVKDNKGGE